MTSKYTGVILAGGKGSRMYPFSEDFPKPLLPICNLPLIEHQIKLMQKVGVKEIIVLIGYYGSKIVNHLGRGKDLGVNIKYVEQKDTLGIAHAVGTLEDHIKKPFLLFLGDIFFIADELSEMFSVFEKGKVNAVLATKIEKDKSAIKRNFAIIENEQGLVERVIEKPRYIVNNLKGCGLYLFDQHIFDSIRRTPRTAMRDEYELTDSIQILINDGFKVKTCTVVEQDINLTYPVDLLKVNLMELKRLKKTSLVGKKVVIPDKKKVINSIIGDDVLVENDIKIENTVIFSDTVVNQTKTIKNSILLFNKMISC